MYEQQQSTLVPDSVRLAISQKEDIGAGNFLATALVKSPAPETPMLFLEVPLQTPWGNYQSLSLKDLDTLSQKYSAWYDELGVTTSDPVGIYMDDGISYLVHYLALVKLGAIAVLINGRMPPAIVARYCKKVGTVGLFLDSGHHQSLTTVSDPSLLGFVGLN